jgi:hypothetical protein
MHLMRRVAHSDRASPSTRSAANAKNGGSSSRRRRRASPPPDPRVADDDAEDEDDRPLRIAPAPTKASMQAVLTALHPGRKLRKDAHTALVAIVRGLLMHMKAILAMSLHIAMFLRHPAPSHLENPTVVLKGVKDAHVVGAVDWFLYDLLEVAGKRAVKRGDDAVNEDDLVVAIDNDPELSLLVSLVTDHFSGGP